MADTVRRRLDGLLAEVPARRLWGAAPTADPSQPDQPFGEEPIPAWDVPEDQVLTIPSESPGRGEPDAVDGAETFRRSRRGSVGRSWVEVAGRFGRRHLAVVAVLVVSGLLWAGWSVVQTRTLPVAVGVTPAPATATPTVSATPTLLVVHVLGRVRTPGLVRVPEGARVADAIAAAGGLTEDADPGELNLAAVVPDGSQIIIGARGQPQGEVRSDGIASGVVPGGGTGSSASVVINLNTATLAQLDTLPGVGAVTAQRILDWRAKHGKFAKVEQLQEVEGIGPKSYADIAPHVRV